MNPLRSQEELGVDGRVIVPDKSDNPVVDLAALWFMEQFNGAGIRFYRRTPGFRDQKAVETVKKLYSFTEGIFPA